MKRLILILLLLLTPFAVPAGQTADLKSQIKTFKNSRRFEVEYDRFKDFTHIRVGPFLIKDHKERGVVQTSAALTFKGDTPRDPISNVSLTFRGNPYSLGETLILILDDERIDLGRGDTLSSGLYSRVSTVMFIIPFEMFERISQAKRVEIQVGRSELRIEEEHQQAFRDLISLARRS